MRYVDLSGPIEPSPPDLIEPLRTDLSYSTHAEGAAQIEAMFGVPADLLRDGEGWTNEEFTKLGTHSTTHVDAPWHYNSQIQGEPAQKIDELPLEWFHNPGVVLDMTHKADGDAVTAAEVEAELERIGHELEPLHIVLVHTGRDEFAAQLDYIARGPGVTAEATHWLFERGVRVMGVDAWGWDAPLHIQAERALASGNPGVFWEAHQADLPYSQIERLVNLGSLPQTGFTVACFPLRIKGASGAPARVVGMVP
ncbi:MAG: cyclase family protein [Thermoleophilaceae bacterium]|nr:cyclase family protein [Thermoleophilaceae bacterium]